MHISWCKAYNKRTGCVQNESAPLGSSKVSTLLSLYSMQPVVHPCEGVHGVTLATVSESAAVASCVQMLFRLLGWAFADSGHKAPDFSALFQALGVQIDVSHLEAGLVRDSNSDGRGDELVKALEAILREKRLAKHEALRLRGRLQFAAGQVFGRVVRASLAVITAHAYSGSSTRLSDDSRLALALHKRLLETGRPRELKPHAMKFGSYKLMPATSLVMPQFSLVWALCCSTPQVDQSSIFHNS